jgi:hypothetical protein
VDASIGLLFIVLAPDEVHRLGKVRRGPEEVIFSYSEEGVMSVPDREASIPGTDRGRVFDSKIVVKDEQDSQFFVPAEGSGQLLKKDRDFFAFIVVSQVITLEFLTVFASSEFQVSARCVASYLRDSYLSFKVLSAGEVSIVEG